MTGAPRSRAAAGPRFVILWRQADWGLYRRRNEALARALATDPRVAGVVHLEVVSLKGLAAMLLRALTARDPELRAVHRLHLRKALSPRPVPVAEGLAVWSLPVPALSPWPPLRRLGRAVLRRRLRRLAAGPPPVLLVYPPHPFLLAVADALAPATVLADLVDDVPALEREPRRRAALEAAFVEILPRCRAVFATSPQLARRYAAHAPGGIECLPNGVQAAPAGDAGAGGEARGGTAARPRVGYVGALNRTLDRALTERLLQWNPAVEFLLIGPVERAAAGFVRQLAAHYPNCRHLGPRQHAAVARYLAGCDVLVNLKRADTTTRGNDSMKIYEYLATGKPVVSTSMAPADRLRDLVYVADEPAAFQRALERALAERDPGLRARRRRAAAENAWERRVERLLACLPAAPRRPAAGGQAR